MAMRFAVRWRPAAYRSTTEAVIVGKTSGAVSGPGGATTPATVGQRVQVCQLIVFDDTKVGTSGNPYVPGSPATEQFLAVVDEVPVTLDITAFDGVTNAQATALWDAARDAQRAVWEADPHIMSYVRAAIGGTLSGYVVVG